MCAPIQPGVWRYIYQCGAAAAWWNAYFIVFAAYSLRYILKIYSSQSDDSCIVTFPPCCLLKWFNHNKVKMRRFRLTSQAPPAVWRTPAYWYIIITSRFTGVNKKVKVFPYSLPSVGPGADPGVQAVSPQVTWSESRRIPSSSLPLLSARPAFTSVALTRWRYL